MILKVKASNGNPGLVPAGLFTRLKWLWTVRLSYGCRIDYDNRPVCTMLSLHMLQEL